MGKLEKSEFDSLNIKDRKESKRKGSWKQEGEKMIRRKVRKAGKRRRRGGSHGLPYIVSLFLLADIHVNQLLPATGDGCVMTASMCACTRVCLKVFARLFPNQILIYFMLRRSTMYGSLFLLTYYWLSNCRFSLSQYEKSRDCSSFTHYWQSDIKMSLIN